MAWTRAPVPAIRLTLSSPEAIVCTSAFRAAVAGVTPSAGADAVLLIAALIRDDNHFAELLNLAHDLGMDALCEAHDAEEIDRLIALDARIIGVNSRDLRTFRTDIQQTGNLLRRIPDDRVSVAESGIRTAEDFRILPADAYLIGETLMRENHPGQKLLELMDGAKCGH